MATRRNKAPNGNEGYLPASRTQPLPQIHQTGGRVYYNNGRLGSAQEVAALGEPLGNWIEVSTFNDTTFSYIWHPYSNTDVVTAGNFTNVQYRFITAATEIAGTASTVANGLQDMAIAFQQVGDSIRSLNYDYWQDPPAVQPLRNLEVVNRKAKELLFAHLTELQLKMWIAENRLHVTAPSGRRYEIVPGHYHNVFLLDQFGKRAREYCAFARDPGGSLPVEDNVFAQLITLQFNEMEFLRKANTWRLPDRLFIGQGVDAHENTDILQVAA